MIQLKRFGKYEIIRKLGRSMTDVYLALDPGRNVRVVLKLIEQARDRYTQIVIEAERRGAQIQRQLHLADPRFLEIYDIGEENGCFFVAMEHFEGQTIAEVLQLEGRLSPKRAGRYAIAVLDQLDRLHAFIPDLDGHRRAVVHGDIKPSNIQIGAGNGNPDVRLLDFGIAKVITYTHNLTSHNLGSPTYCSPERLARGQVDAQADLWALGVSLYEMVAGSLPYQAQSTRKLENLIQSRRPPRALPGDCPARLRAIISKALAADIERRYASAADFERDLRAFVEDKATVAEQEKMPAWDANETLRTEPPTRSLTSRLANPAAALRRELAAGAGPVAVGVLLGLFVVAPVSYWYNVRSASRPLRTADYSRRTIPQINADWNLFKRLERDNGFLGELSPAISLGQELRTKLAKAGDAVIERYRNGSDPALEDFDWAKARVCFLYAVQLDAADHEIRGKLALCDGYINLIANPKLPKAAASEANFLSAVWDLPQSPDPHLALARLYTFAFRNAGKASGEFAEAETRGFRIGPREHEQQADGYLFRAEWALRQAGRATAQPSKTEEVRWLRQAARDLDRAQSLFEPIVGFSSVSAGLEQLDRDRSSEEAMRAALQQAQAQAEAKAKPKRPGRRRAVTGSRSGDN